MIFVIIREEKKKRSCISSLVRLSIINIIIGQSLLSCLCNAKSHFNQWEPFETLNSEMEYWDLIQCQKRRHLKILQSKLQHFKIHQNRIQKCWISMVKILTMGTRQAFTRDSFTNYESICWLHTFHENLGMLSVVAKFFVALRHTSF